MAIDAHRQTGSKLRKSAVFMTKGFDSCPPRGAIQANATCRTFGLPNNVTYEDHVQKKSIARVGTSANRIL